MYLTVVEHDNPIVSMRFMGFDHWISCAPTSDMYIKKQKNQDTICVIFQTYYLTKDQRMGNLFRNLVLLSTTFHLERCKQLESPAICNSKLCNARIHNPVLNTIRKL